MTQMLREARERIRDIRMREVVVRLRDEGQALPDTSISIRMKNHDFLFGAVSYFYGTTDHPGKNSRFTEWFTRLFNYTMVPFHWNWYEPERGSYDEPYTGNLARWAKANGLKSKLHALIWHECCPTWLGDDEVEEAYIKRLTHLMEQYGDSFDFFDLINEITVADRFDNPVSRWIKQKGDIEVIKFGTELVRSLKPDVPLIYGEWNVHGEEYPALLQRMRDADVDIDLLGIQSHMHRDLWSHEEAWRVMETAAAFGWPIHFPEVSVCSGKPLGQMSYLPGAKNVYTETPEDALWQAEFTRDFYTILFSHPAVEAVSWFDFVDHRWLGAPAGLVDDDLHPKPVYTALWDLIHREWHSDADLTSSESGVADARLFFGQYEITVYRDGEARTFDWELKRPSFYTGNDEALVLDVDWNSLKPQ